MKKLTKYMALGALLLSGAAATGCQDSFDDAKVEIPVATLEPNITIAEFKELMWQDAENYCVEIPAREDGSHYIVSGRVISSDYDGNIFKSLVIQDATGALPMSINQYNLYLTHRIGQELVIDLTGMSVGKYAGYFQLGSYGWYEAQSTSQTSFMAPELFNAHCELNGLPEADKVETIVLDQLPGSSAAELQKYQGQRVRFNNVIFKNAGQPGQQLCDTYHSSGFNQALVVNGSELTVRTSGYAKFWNMPLPAEAFDIEGILGYFNGWQFLLISADGIMNVGNPTAQGTKAKPYEVEEAIALAGSTASTVAWVKGIIVGTVAPEVTSIANMADITTAEPFIMNNSLVIAPAATDFTIDQIMVVNLPEGTPLAEYGNLVDNPSNLGKELLIQGRFGQELNVAAVINSTGTTSTFAIEGVDLPDDPNAPAGDGNGSEQSPYTCAQVLTLGNPATTSWVTGYIVGGYNFDLGQAVQTDPSKCVNSNILIAATPNETDWSKCIAVQLPAGTLRDGLNLVSHPENLGQAVAVCGSLEKYCGIPGVKNTSAAKLNGQAVGGSSSSGSTDVPTGGDGSAEKPYTVAQLIALNNPGTTAWVEGVIVGTYKYDLGQSVQTDPANFDATNLILAQTAGETDWSKCVAIQLPAGAVRDALNLVNNGGNLGKTVAVKGTLVKYCGLPGVKETSEYKLDGQSTPDTPDQPSEPAQVTGAGTQASPYTCTDVIALNNPGTKAWAEGYIVGTMSGSSAKWGLTDAVATNLLIAPTADCTDLAKCVPVELPLGSARTELNLVDHPANLGKLLKVEGTLTKYFSRPGIKAPTTWTI